MSTHRSRFSTFDTGAFMFATWAGAGAPEWLYFDAQTGLRLRKRTTLQTPAGNSPFQVTYGDYRDTGSGVKFPFLIRMDPAGHTSNWPRLRRFTSPKCRITRK